MFIFIPILLIIFISSYIHTNFHNIINKKISQMYNPSAYILSTKIIFPYTIKTVLRLINKVIKIFFKLIIVVTLLLFRLPSFYSMNFLINKFLLNNSIKYKYKF